MVLGLNKIADQLSNEVRDGLVEAWHIIRPEMRKELDGVVTDAEHGFENLIQVAEEQLRSIVVDALSGAEKRIEKQIKQLENNIKTLEVQVQVKSKDHD